MLMVSQSLTGAISIPVRRFARAILGVAAAIAVVSPAIAGPAVATRWAEAKMPQDDCLKRAEAAIERAGFGKLERTTQSRYGTRDDYTAAIRCVVDNGIVFFIASGPSRTVTDELAGTLFKNF